MDHKEAYFFLDALRTEFPRMEFPVSCKCTQEHRQEFRGKIMEALNEAISVLGAEEAPDRSVQHGH